MKYRIDNVGLWLDESDELLSGRAAKRLGIDRSAVKSVRIARSVLDARKKGFPRFLYTLEVALESALPRLPDGVHPIVPPLPPPLRVKAPLHKPIIVGSGPAGLFCALGLLERGVQSLVLERGREVTTRRRDVARLMRDGSLDPESNMNFGEGGAGTFTDGKLYTRVHHPLVRKVLEDLARFGAPERILVEAKPHIGSDLLPSAVARLRETLIAGGCEVRFGTRVDDLIYRDDRCAGVRLADGAALESDRVILAPGNSAAELFERFVKDGRVRVDPKAFAIGFRAEHPQQLVDQIQYGRAAGHPKLPPSEYKLAVNLPDGEATRGVYSFCMCPGGLVVPTPTEQGHLVTNGMSNSHRNARFANAGLVVSVAPADFAKEGFSGPLAGLEFMRHWERKAFQMGGGRFAAPSQSIPDYLAGRSGGEPRRSSYRPAVVPSDLNQLLPDWLNAALKAALRDFGRKMRGYVSEEGTLIALESRTSSPVRLTRGEDLQSVSLPGLYPSGEGCGYAGGIVSSAIDGLRIAEHIGAELA